MMIIIQTIGIVKKNLALEYFQLFYVFNKTGVQHSFYVLLTQTMRIHSASSNLSITFF